MVPSIMRWAMAGLLPARLVSLWVFGWQAVRVLILALVFCMVVEWLCLRLLGTPGSLHDQSAAMVGVVLGMILPPTAPWWMVAVGAVVAILVAKHLFGGLGANIFNPAATARVFLLVSWPTQMTSWWPAGERRWPFSDSGVDTITEVTPLGILRDKGPGELTVTYQDLLLGNTTGSVGEISALALLLGGGMLLVKRIISWEIPVSFVGSAALVTGLAYLLGGSQDYVPPHFHMLSGGLLLGAFFMATDPATSPLGSLARLLFGCGCGVLTAVIRLWGGYPEGVAFAILLMNATVPLLDRYLPPRAHVPSATTGAAR